MTRVLAPPFGFTPQQREWYESLVPDVPEEAVAELVHEYGYAGNEDDLLQEAHLGTARGVRTFDVEKAAKGDPDFDPVKSGALRTWVFFSALHAAQDALRIENRANSPIVGRVWDGAIEILKHRHDAPRVMGTRAGDRAALKEFGIRAAAGAIARVAAMEVPTGGADELHRRGAAHLCAEVLRRAVAEMSERRHELVRLHFADGESVKDAAAARGEKGYRAELDQFHRGVDFLAARLTGAGFHHLPPFPPEARGTILVPSEDDASEDEPSEDAAPAPRKKP